jgi:hypothetical protein
MSEAKEECVTRPVRWKLWPVHLRGEDDPTALGELLGRVDARTAGDAYDLAHRTWPDAPKNGLLLGAPQAAPERPKKGKKRKEAANG